MGICSSCFRAEDGDIPNPDVETRRRIQAEAAERRRVENESRGIKNVEKVRQQQKRAEEHERREQEAAKYGSNQPALRWQQD